MSHKPLNLTGMPSRKDLIDEALRLGCRVVDLPSTGEAAVILPDGSRVRFNNRRKDGTKALLTPLRRLQQAEHAAPST
jgi:hypothetical protein